MSLTPLQSFRKLAFLIATLFATLITFDACHQTPQTNAEEYTFSVGKKLMDNKCVSCHHPTSPANSRLAPPMYAVKLHYLEAYPEEADFVAKMKAFLQNPNKENVLLKGAVEKFGVMPAMQFPEEEIEAIAIYMYHNKLTKPEWFDEHFKEHKRKRKHKAMKNDTTLSPLEKGKAMALKTKAALGKNLMQAINERGAAGAVEFCNVKALPITDSLAQLQNANIKRVSDKNRNPLNAANEDELAYIIASKKELESGNSIKPQVKEVNGKWVGYYPILTNAMCLQCHGKEGNQIAVETLAKIKEKYPEDKATGYGENELRGIWVVEF